MSDFPEGIRIIFTTQNKDGGMIQIDVPSGRKFNCEKDTSSWMTARDASGKFLGWFPAEHILCVLPLQTIGPADENLSK